MQRWYIILYITLYINQVEIVYIVIRVNFADAVWYITLYNFISEVETVYIVIHTNFADTASIYNFISEVEIVYILYQISDIDFMSFIHTILAKFRM